MEGNAMSTLINALVSGFTTMANDALNAMAQIAPVVLPILAAIIVIGIVIRVVRRIVGR